MYYFWREERALVVPIARKPKGIGTACTRSIKKNVKRYYNPRYVGRYGEEEEKKEASSWNPIERSESLKRCRLSRATNINEPVVYKLPVIIIVRWKKFLFEFIDRCVVCDDASCFDEENQISKFGRG